MDLFLFPLDGRAFSICFNTKMRIYYCLNHKHVIIATQCMCLYSSLLGTCCLLPSAVENSTKYHALVNARWLVKGHNSHKTKTLTPILYSTTIFVYSTDF